MQWRATEQTQKKLSMNGAYAPVEATCLPLFSPESVSPWERRVRDLLGSIRPTPSMMNISPCSASIQHSILFGPIRASKIFCFVCGVGHGNAPDDFLS